MHNCPCCGDAVYSQDDILCDVCHLEGCSYTKDSAGDWGWFNCQRTDISGDEGWLWE